MRFGGGTERERRVHDGRDGAGVEQRPHALAQPARDRALFGNRSWTKGRARKRQAPLQHWNEIQLRPGPTDDGNLDQPAVHRQHVEVSRHIIAADDVEERLAALEKEDRIEQLLAEMKTKRGA